MHLSSSGENICSSEQEISIGKLLRQKKNFVQSLSLGKNVPKWRTLGLNLKFKKKNLILPSGYPKHGLGGEIDIVVELSVIIDVVPEKQIIF